MRYTVCRMEHKSGQIAFLDSFGTEDEAKMYLANAVEAVIADRSDLSDRDIREQVDKAVRDGRFEVRNASGERDTYYYIDKE